MNAPLPAVDIARFHAGDERLFAELVRTYSPRLLPQLRRYARSARVDANDLLQDVWLRAFARRRDFEGRGSLLGWLLTICRTVGLAAVAKEARYVGLDDVAQPVTEQMHSDLFAERARLQQAVDALPSRQREVVMLRIVEDRSTADAARVLGVAEGTVKAALHAALHKLQEMLRERVR